MSMAASIETRVPYLDHHLVEFAFSLPDSAKIRWRTGKYLLKRSSGDLLPADVIHRPKRGFPVPIAQWFAAPGNPFLDVLLDPSSLRDGLLDATFVESRVRHFREHGGNSMELWTMLNLEMWRREFVAPSSRVSMQAA
jgi:asparagine synthase (glutamine-hydrolysing)